MGCDYLIMEIGLMNDVEDEIVWVVMISRREMIGWGGVLVVGFVVIGCCFGVIVDDFIWGVWDFGLLVIYFLGWLVVILFWCGCKGY